jgi:hypothetical protein
MEYKTPEEILSVATEEIAAFIAKYSRNRLGIEIAEELRSAAESSFEIDMVLECKSHFVLSFSHGRH